MSGINQKTLLKKHKKTILTFIIVITVIALSIGAAYLYRINNALNNIQRAELLPTTEPSIIEIPTETPQPTVSTETPTSPPPSPTPTPTLIPKPTSIPKPIKTTEKITEDPIEKEIETIKEEKNYIPKYTNKEPRAEGTINVLLLGSDARPDSKNSRSDTIMIAHIPANKEGVYLISIPRDSYVDIPGVGRNKINAAFAYGGAPLTVKTVENVLNIQINHVAAIDFEGFTKLIDNINGVTINNPHEGCDKSQGFCWEAGELNLNSTDALRYVRWRKGLPMGDITRTENQQRVVKAMLNKIMSREVLTDPNKILEIAEQTGSFILLDSTLTNQKIIEYATNMNIDSSNDIKTVGFPIKGFATKKVGSVNIIDKTKLDKLQHSLYTDTMNEY